MNGNIISIISKAGAIGIAIFTIGLLGKIILNDLSHIGEYIQDATVIQTELVGSIQQLNFLIQNE